MMIFFFFFPPQLAALEFPPKKLFGNRDERMVAERRNHLEVALPSRFHSEPKPVVLPGCDLSALHFVVPSAT